MPSTKTHVPHGDKISMVHQAAGLFTTHMHRNSTLNRLVGSMPSGTAGAVATLRKQTTQHMPIVRAQDLGKGKGDEVTFHLLNPVSAYPIMGSRYAEGRGTGLSITEEKLRVNQARFPIDLGDTMTTIRSPVDFRRLGRPVAQNLMDRYADQSLLVHMAGARGFHDNIEWVVPVEEHPLFDEVMVNEVKAPSKNRHFLSDAGGTAVKPFTVNAGEVDITTADVLKMDTIDAMRTVIDQVPLPPPSIRVEGDDAAEDSPLRVWLMSPAMYNKFAADPAFRQFQAAALQRATMNGRNHPLFRGEAGIWNGFLLLKMPRPIRFYAGDPIRYSPNLHNEDEATATVPASFGTDFAVDRSVILGGQAVAEAFASSERSGIPFFWSEKWLDHDDKVELLIGTIRGVKKIRFTIDTGTGSEVTDYGVTVLDAAVPTVGPRN